MAESTPTYSAGSSTGRAAPEHELGGEGLQGASPERMRLIQHLFEESIDLPAGERTSFLERTCAGDPDLRDAVERLLHAEVEADDFLAASVTEPREGLGTRRAHRVSEGAIGKYEILGKIGQGGTSSVYLARRRDRRFRHRYAVKILRGPVSDPALAQRIADEARVLGQLDHPFIARLVDADHTSDGAPYIVMEYVHGRPITEYCDRHRMPVERRLELFVRVCEAVEYLHHNLVLHRDLKPGNVLIGREGSPKLLDFGLAKLLEPAGCANSTTSTLRIATPNYASPEHLSGQRVTTASDTYSLGVILYELLTGRRPHEWQDHSLYEIIAGLPERSVVLPSVAVAERESHLEEAAAQRSTSGAGLVKKLRGDLDRIVLKALRFEPGERYSTPAELSADLERFRNGLPVRARSATWRYRIAKFCRRNALSLAYGTLLAALLAAFAVVASVQATRLAAERDVARQAESRADQVTRFLTEAFTVNSPYRSDGREITARQVLERGAERLERELSQQPELQADLRHTIGNVYLNMGLFEEARKHLERALAQREAGGAPPERRSATLQALAEAQRGLGRLDLAETSVRSALDLLRAAGEGSGVTAATQIRLLADVLSETGRHDEAEPLVREALRMHAALEGDAGSGVADDLNSLGMILYRRGDFDGAVAAGRRCLEIVDRHPRSNAASRATVVGNLAAALRAQGRLREAAPLYERTLQLRRQIYGDEHPVVANSLNNYALLQVDLGKDRLAEQLMREALDINLEAYGEDSPIPWINRTNLAEILDSSGDLDEAATLGQAAARFLEERLDASHPAVSYALHTAGTTLLHLDRLDEARPVLERALEIRMESLPSDHAQLALSRFAAARLEHATGRLGEAETAYRSLLDEGRAVWRPEQWQPAWIAAHLADLLASTGRQGEALPLVEEAARSLGELYPEDHPKVATAHSVLGLALAGTGRPEEGCPRLRDGYRTLVRRLGPSALDTTEAKRRLEAAAPHSCLP